MMVSCMKSAMPGIRDLQMTSQQSHMSFHSVNKRFNHTTRGTVQSQVCCPSTQ